MGFEGNRPTASHRACSSTVWSTLPTTFVPITAVLYVPALLSMSAIWPAEITAERKAVINDFIPRVFHVLLVARRKYLMPIS